MAVQHLVVSFTRGGGRAVAFQIKVEDEPDRLSLDSIDIELLLDLLSTAFSFDNLVAERAASIRSRSLALRIHT